MSTYTLPEVLQAEQLWSDREMGHMLCPDTVQTKNGLWVDPVPILPLKYRAAPCAMIQRGAAR